MKVRILFVVAGVAAAALTGCATHLVQMGGVGYDWNYRTNYGVGDSERPIGIYGPPETAAVYILECVPTKRSIEFISLEVEPFEGTRPISLSSARATWRGDEAMDPPDLQAMSRATIPLDHPIFDEIAKGAAIGVIALDGVDKLAGGAIPARVVRECRSQSTAR